MKFNSLMRLNLSYNKLGSFLKELLKEESSMFSPNLEELFLVCCSLEDTELKLLAAVMRKLENLLEIDLSHNPFKNNLSTLMN